MRPWGEGQREAKTWTHRQTDRRGGKERRKREPKNVIIAIKLKTDTYC